MSQLDYRNTIKTIDLLENRLLLVINNRDDLNYLFQKPKDNEINNKDNRLNRMKSNSSMTSLINSNKTASKKTVTIVTPNETSNEWNDKIFPVKGIVLYFKLLGELYYNLYNKVILKSTNNLRSKLFLYEYSNRCIKSCKISVMIAEKVLEITSELRLLCILNYCKFLRSIKNQYNRTRRLITVTLTNASSYDNNYQLSVNSIKILESFRKMLLDQPDKQSSFPNDALKNLNSTKKFDSNIILWDMFVDIVISDDESVDSNINIISNEIPMKSSKFNLLSVTRKKISSSANQKNIDHNLELIRYFRRIFYLPTPILLENISSANEILKALDKIFRIYVRGNSLSGQRIDGNTISMDNGHNPLSISTFLLSGPYLSWHGFLSILRDFNISKMIQSKSESHSDKAKDTNMIQPPINIKQAAMIFIECSRTNSPVLTLSKYLTIYDEITKKLVIDPWSDVYEWLVNEDWDIKAGLNFMQFIDCLGKFGIIAYSDDRFTTIFPSTLEKIEHFLSAHLGLTDHRKWEVKVEKKFKYTKDLVKGLISLSPMKNVNINTSNLT